MNTKILLTTFCLGSALIACGRAPSSLLRQGQIPIYDFPLYVTERLPGKVWKYDRDRSRTLLVSGLNSPVGIATDKFNHLFVVEQGLNRVVRVDVFTGATTVVRSGLSTPSAIAVDSFGDAYVIQEGANNIVRVRDGNALVSFSSRPTSIVFGVNDIPIVSLDVEERVVWNPGRAGEVSAYGVTEATNVSIDGTGRVYASEGSALGARIHRFHQRDPGGQTIVAEGLVGPSGIAVDPVGNMYFIEVGANEINIVTYTGNRHQFSLDSEPLVDGRYLAFTQY